MATPLWLFKKLWTTVSWFPLLPPFFIRYSRVVSLFFFLLVTPYGGVPVVSPCLRLRLRLLHLLGLRALKLDTD